MMTFIFFLGILATAIVWTGVVLFNRLIASKNQVEYAHGAIEALLRKRYDLIPNLVVTVQEYMAHERGVLDRLTALRTQAMNQAIGAGQRMQIETDISGALRGFFAVAEHYPTLRANENFLHLQASLNEVEDQLSASRRAYNAAVMDWNNAIEMFPSNQIARRLNYQRRDMFGIPEEERLPLRLREVFRK